MREERALEDGFSALSQRLADNRPAFDNIRTFPTVSSVAAAQDFLEDIQNQALDDQFLLLLYLMLRQPNAARHLDDAFKTLEPSVQLRDMARDRVRLYFLSYKIDRLEKVSNNVEQLWGSMLGDFLEEIVGRCET